MVNAASLSARKRYRKDIIAVILLKLVALLGLWMLFFSDPVKRHLTVELIEKHFVR